MVQLNKNTELIISVCLIIDREQFQDLKLLKGLVKLAALSVPANYRDFVLRYHIITSYLLILIIKLPNLSYYIDHITSYFLIIVNKFTNLKK